MPVSLLDQIVSRRNDVAARLDSLTRAVEARGANAAFSVAEESEFRSLVAEESALKDRQGEVEARGDLDRAGAAAAARFMPSPSFQPSVGAPDLRSARGAYEARARITSQPMTYRKGDPKVSYFRDLLMAQRGDFNAAERLQKNTREVENAFGEMDYRAIDTTAGSFGAFAPPLYMIDQFVELARPGRPFAELVTSAPLPTGVSSINVPKISSGSSVALQTTQNTVVSNTDPVATNLTAPVQTLAGFVVISQQDIDQSPIPMDDVILGDLTADYARQLDNNLITATAAASAAAGTLQTYTDASPTTLKVWYQIGAAVSSVHSQRFVPPTAVVMRPDRWARFTNYLAADGRPFVLADSAYGAFNSFGSNTPGYKDGIGIAGTVHGIPVITDASIPNNLGAGNNQDRILVVKADDLMLWEGIPRAEALAQTYGTSLGVLLRLYNYFAFQPARQPKGVISIEGTGLILNALGS